MDNNSPLGSPNTTVSSKKLPFSPAERELITKLVRERPIIEDKCTNAKNIELKKKAWADLAVVYNSQPYITQRLSKQLKRCWENMKTQRKKELSQESVSVKRTGGSKKILSEGEAKVKRTTINIQQDRELHELRIQREKILIARENNLLEYEKEMHGLQIQKMKLEIELMIKQDENKIS